MCVCARGHVCMHVCIRVCVCMGVCIRAWVLMIIPHTLLSRYSLDPKTSLINYQLA